jgi:hypothetical protein
MDFCESGDLANVIAAAQRQRQGQGRAEDKDEQPGTKATLNINAKAKAKTGHSDDAATKSNIRNGGQTNGDEDDDDVLPANRVLHITVQLLLALQHMHARNLIHRDLKPVTN